jgi:PAS domain S-box-containing protein
MDPTNKNRFHRLLLDAVGQAVIATDPLGKVIYLNRVAEDLYGWSAKEVIGRPIVEVTPSEELTEQAEEIMGELSHGRSWSGEFMVRRKDGSTFPAMVTDTPVHDEQGTLVAIVGVSMDITEIKQTEELRRSEERFRLLAENAQDLIALYRFKPTPGFEYASPSATTITGYTPEEYYADPELAYKIVHPDDAYLLDETLHQPEAPSVIRWVRKDGRVVWTEQRNKPIYDEMGELVAIEGIARDITERVRGDEKLKESERRFSSVVSNANSYVYRCLNEPGYQSEVRRPHRGGGSGQGLGGDPEGAGRAQKLRAEVRYPSQGRRDKARAGIRSRSPRRGRRSGCPGGAGLRHHGAG